MEKRVRLTAKYSETKKGYGVPEDCLSELPDEILACILSFLPVREASTTCFLSSRWRYLWLYITGIRIDFNGTKALRNIRDALGNIRDQSTERPGFIKWVNHFLGEYDEFLTIDEFRISFDLDESSAEVIYSWIQFAITRQVRRLELDLLGIRPYNGLSSSLCKKKCRQLLTQKSCGCSPTQFYLSLQSISPSTFLKELYLKNVCIADEFVEYFLANGPNLERLSVCGARRLVKLRVSETSSRSLKHLEVVCCISLETIEICDTNLISFKYVGRSTKSLMLHLKNVPLLVNVYISDRHYVYEMLCQLLCCLSQLQILTLELCKDFEDKVACLCPQLKNLKKLVLEVGAWNYEDLLGLTPLINACPYLRIFVLRIPSWKNLRYVKRIKHAYDKRKMWKECRHEYLKVVKIAGYSGRICEFEFVTYLIKNAVALEKILIDPRHQIVNGTPLASAEFKKEQTSRLHAKRQLEAEVPPTIELVIL